MASELIKVVRKYRTLDDQLKELNAKVNKLREERKIAELEMADYLRSPKFAGINKLELSDVNTVVKIQRPEMWAKPWTLSIRNLKDLMDAYWATPAPHTAEGCFKYIVEARKKDLVSTDFAFTRNSLKTDSDEENANV